MLGLKWLTAQELQFDSQKGDENEPEIGCISRMKDNLSLLIQVQATKCKDLYEF